MKGITPLTDSHLGLHVLLVAGYIVLSLPYMYRAIDTGMRAIAIRQLAEAAQSLGADSWLIMTRIIMPNIVPSLISGGFITFAIVFTAFILPPPIKVFGIDPVIIGIICLLSLADFSYCHL